MRRDRLDVCVSPRSFLWNGIDDIFGFYSGGTVCVSPYVCTVSNAVRLRLSLNILDNTDWRSFVSVLLAVPLKVEPRFSRHTDIHSLTLFLSSSATVIVFESTGSQCIILSFRGVMDCYKLTAHRGPCMASSQTYRSLSAPTQRRPLPRFSLRDWQ